MRRAWLLAMAWIAALAPLAAAGERGPARRAVRFAELDGNGDGKLDADEFRWPALFRRADANGDGALTLEELRRWRRQHEATTPTDGRSAPADQTSRAPAPEPRPPLISEPIAEGFAIVDGRYLPPPYTLAWEDGGLRINGRAVLADGPAAGPQHRGRRAGGKRLRASRAIARYEQALRADNLLVAPRGEFIRVFGRVKAAEVLDALVSDASEAAKVQGLTEAGVGALTSSQWAEIVRRFEADAALPARLAALKKRLADEGMDVEEPSAAQVAFVRAIGAVSTLLAALALGVLLTHRPDGRGGWRGVEESGRGSRLVLLCAGLLVVLNGFDLAVTLLARGSETFLELNPLVASFIDSAGAVVAFKVGLVLPCVGLLLVLRRRRLVQLAAWWSCLFYTLVMVRWAVYNTMFLT